MSRDIAEGDVVMIPLEAEPFRFDNYYFRRGEEGAGNGSDVSCLCVCSAFVSQQRASYGMNEEAA